MESFLQLSQTIVESPDLNPKECRSWDRLFALPGHPARGPLAVRYEAEAEGPIRLTPPLKGHATSQNMQNFESDWSGDTQLFWHCPEQGLEITLSFEVTGQGSGLRFAFTQARDYGTFEVSLDDEKIVEAVDLYNPRVLPTKHDVSGLTINTGQHTLKFKCVGKNDQSKNYFFGLDFFEVTGHKPPSSSESAAITDIDEIRRRLEKLMRRAFRRPVDPETLDRFTKFADAQIASGVSLEATMRTVIGAILGMPDFVYFYETPQSDPKALRSDVRGKGVDGEKIDELTQLSGVHRSSPGRPGRQRVDDFELASRLAQFLWSSIPDDELLVLAEQGRLQDPLVLEQQARRMLADSRSTALVNNFAGQWLYLRNLQSIVPDAVVFPEFDDNLREAFVRETELFVESLVREDQSVIDLLGANYTFANERLATHYGIPGVYGSHFRRVPLDGELAERRGGILGHGSLLTATSYPNRTSPVLRGKWLLTNILGSPPAAPPADVPDLPDRGEDGRAATVRDRLVQHRENPACAGCHAPMDPLGLALENYDAVGRWRTTGEAELPIDASGNLPDGTQFVGPPGLRTLLLERREEFARTVTEKLLAYAIGRGPEYYDKSTVRAITREAASDGYRWSDIIVGIVQSTPFRMRRLGS